MTRAPKKPLAPPPTEEEGETKKAPAAKVEVQFGPTPTAPGSRLKRGKGS